MPLETLKNWFRRRSLARIDNKVPTALLPLSQIRNALVLIDVEDPSFDACKGAVAAFLRENGIKGTLFFLDFRKIDGNERLITSITNTILRKDVNWYGEPSREKMALLEREAADLLISLTDRTDFSMEYLVKAVPARFKVGRRQLSGSLFDLVVKDPDGAPGSEERSFVEMVNVLNKIV